MTVQLDGALMTDRKTAHDYLQHVLKLPAHYGRNLDALYDILTERGEETHLVLINSAKLAERLGRYGTLLVSTLSEAAEHNESLMVTIE